MWLCLNSDEEIDSTEKRAVKLKIETGFSESEKWSLPTTGDKEGTYVQWGTMSKSFYTHKIILSISSLLLLLNELNSSEWTKGSLHTENLKINQSFPADQNKCWKVSSDSQ